MNRTIAMSKKRYCCVTSCKNFYGCTDKEVHMFRFPKHREIAEKWNSFIGIDVNKVLTGKICSDHFEDECFLRKNKTAVKPNAIPTKQPNSNNVNSLSVAKSTSSDSLASVNSTINRNGNPSVLSPDTMFQKPLATSSECRIPLLTSTITTTENENASLDIESTINAFNDQNGSSFAPTVAAADYEHASLDIESTINTFNDQNESSFAPTVAAVAAADYENASSATKNRNVSICTECKLKNELIAQKDAQINILRKQLKKARQKIWYMEKLKEKLKSEFSELKKKSLVTEELCKTLEVLKTNQLFRVLHHGVKSGQKYPEEVRHFCISLVAHSPRAYGIIRRTFHNHLPTLKTIKNWFANSDIRSDPGIQEGTLDRLKKIAGDFEKINNRRLMCSLVFDEVHIRQQVIYSLDEMEYTGFTSYGINTEETSEDTKKTVAKQAIVFLLNGITVNFEFPVAYYFISELNAAQRKELLNEIIATVTKCGIKITNCTFDGHSCNVPAFEMLGAFLKWKTNGKNQHFQTFIVNPINNERIYIILDPSHMEKLVRNQLASCKVFFDENGDKIEWRYIEALYEYSIKNNFHSHKLTKKHIDWKRHAMNVRIAVETLSESVAKSIQFLMDKKIPEFQGAQPTIDFIRRMDKLFDCFNSRHSKDKNIFKRTLSAENQRIVFDFFDETIEYFSSLKVEVSFYRKEKNEGTEKNESGKSKSELKKDRVVDRVEIRPILHTCHKTGFRGFIISMTSVKEMFKEYVENEHYFNSIPTYNLLQDVLEMMFARIRSCGGFNNNPNVFQFKGAFRKVVCNMKMDLAVNTNCRMFDMNLPENLFYSNIYFISSKRPKIILNKQTYENQKESILEVVEDECEWHPEYGWITPSDERIMSDIDGAIASADPEVLMLNGSLDISDFMILHHAISIESNLMNIIGNKGFYCNAEDSSCHTVFDENEKFLHVDMQSSSYVPCKSTMDICKKAEQYFKLYNGQQSKPRYDFKTLYCLIFRTMDMDRLYPNSNFQCDPTHKYQFIKCIVGQYIAKRALQIAKQTTLARQDKLIREQCTRLVNFRGQ